MLRYIFYLLILACCCSCGNNKGSSRNSSYEELKDTVPLADTNNHNKGNHSTVTLDSVVPTITPADTTYPG